MSDEFCPKDGVTPRCWRCPKDCPIKKPTSSEGDFGYLPETQIPDDVSFSLNQDGKIGASKV
jgi:hypothetical protein